MTYLTTIALIATCPICGAKQHIVVEKADYQRWQEGALVQDAFPYLSADDREALISGICSECWERMWG